MIGIYKITNKINGKAYIGQSINIEQRWHAHKYTPCSSLIHLAIQKYGINNFIFEVIEECDVKLLNEKEIYYIQYYNTLTPNGYNKDPGGFLRTPTFQKTNPEEINEIKSLLKNTALTQREIANRYNLSEDFIFAINKGLNCVDPNETYPLRKREKQKFYCSKCGIEIFSNTISGLCRECYTQSTRTVKRPDKFTLANEIVNTNFCAVGRKYGVTDNAIRKWCKAYNLPTKKDELKKWLEQNKEI